VTSDITDRVHYALMDTIIAPLLAHYRDATIQTRRPSAEAYQKSVFAESLSLAWRVRDQRQNQHGRKVYSQRGSAFFTDGSLHWPT